MIHSSVLKGVVAGIGILILGQILYIAVLVKISGHELLRFVLLAFPMLAAFVAAYLAQRRKLVVGNLMAIFGASISLLSALGYEYFGFHVDHIGGLVATFTILVAYNSVFCLVGSLAGYFLSQRKSVSGARQR